MKEIVLDCSNITTETEFWELYVERAHPEHAEVFGRNLDAFWDALHGGPDFPGECAIALTNTGSLAQINEGQFLTALRTIASDCKSIALLVE